MRIWSQKPPLRPVSPLAEYQYDVRPVSAIRRETLNFELSPEPGYGVSDAPRRTNLG
ncbi:MAG TPA: hypothetical protein VIJ86_06655 [Acidimicrobiales bacterium]